MKMLITVVQDEDASRLGSGLMNEGYSITKLASTGGLLRSGNTTLLIGVEDDQMEDVLALIKQLTKSRKKRVDSSEGKDEAKKAMGAQGSEVTVGGANVFVLDVENFRHV